MVVQDDELNFGARLKKIRESKGFTVRQAANQADVSSSYWSQVENKKRSVPTPKTLRRMARGLRVSETSILSLAGLTQSEPPLNAIGYDPRNVVALPVLSTVKCGPNGLAMDDFHGFEYASRDDIDNTDDYFWLITTGDSMIGDHIQSGDYALIKKTQAFENGDICAVIVDGEEGTLKHVNKTQNTLTLSSSNPSYPPRVFVGEQMNEVYIAGKLIEIKHKF